MWLTLDGGVYRRIHHLIVPSKNGTSQIDHLLVSPYGIFIIETKNIQGWIFGSANQPHWTQSLYGKNYSFQNPLKQTFRQKRVLSEYLCLSESLIHTVVYFAGNCKFRSQFPHNVLESGLSTYIKRYQKIILSPEEISRILQKLNKLALESPLTSRDHLNSLRERHSSTAICPKCGSKLIEKTARKGPMAGSKFLGCEKYPRCRFTRNID